MQWTLCKGLISLFIQQINERVPFMSQELEIQGRQDPCPEEAYSKQLNQLNKYSNTKILVSIVKKISSYNRE